MSFVLVVQNLDRKDAVGINIGNRMNASAIYKSSRITFHLKMGLICAKINLQADTFPNEWFGTKTRFDEEAKGDLKVAFWRNVCNSLTVRHLRNYGQRGTAVSFSPPLPSERSDTLVLFVTYLSLIYSQSTILKRAAFYKCGVNVSASNTDKRLIIKTIFASQNYVPIPSGRNWEWTTS